MTTKKRTTVVKRPRPALGGFGEPIPNPKKEVCSESEQLNWLSHATEMTRQQLLARVDPEEGDEVYLLTVAVVNGKVHMSTSAPVFYVKEMNAFVEVQIRRAEREARRAELEALEARRAELEAELAALDGL